MKPADLPVEEIADLYQDNWRLDVDPGVDSKHEFWMAWRHFIVLPEIRPPFNSQPRPTKFNVVSS